MGRSDELIAKHVHAIEAVAHRTVLCLVIQDDDGTLSVITPEATRTHVLWTLAQVNWQEAAIRSESEH